MTSDWQINHVGPLVTTEQHLALQKMSVGPAWVWLDSFRFDFIHAWTMFAIHNLLCEVVSHLLDASLLLYGPSVATPHTHKPDRGSDASVASTIAFRRLHQHALKRWQAWSHTKGERLQLSISYWTNSFHFFVFSVSNLSLCTASSASASRSLQAGEQRAKQVEQQPTLLRLCLTCEFELLPPEVVPHMGPNAPRLILIKLWNGTCVSDSHYPLCNWSQALCPHH